MTDAIYKLKQEKAGERERDRERERERERERLEACELTGSIKSSLRP